MNAPGLAEGARDDATTESARSGAAGEGGRDDPPGEGGRDDPPGEGGGWAGGEAEGEWAEAERERGEGESDGALFGGESDERRPTVAHDGFVAGARLRQYEIVRPLGRGGMGSVFLARDTKLGRLVAIKVLHEHSDEKVQRFLAEARATARCRHENIVVIYEADEFGGCPYMVLEYLEGRTLHDWLLQRAAPAPPGGPADGGAAAAVPPGLAVELILPVVRALVCAHASGIVHRDLKPANVFLTDEGPVKVLDFGIAKRRGADELTALAGATPAPSGVDELTRPGTLLGTLPYMAPEQWLGDEVDARADLWAVGILLFRLVTGAHPLAPVGSVLQLAQVAVLEVPMPRVDSRRPGLGPLAAIIDRCLQKRRADRFDSARSLQAALEALGADRDAPALGEGGSPFAGLAPFQEGDAARFFGREAEAAAVLGRLRSQPLVAVAGPSGAGKSSLVRAGVVPALRRASPETEVAVLRPGRRPLEALAELLLLRVRAGSDAAAGPASAHPVEGVAARLLARPGLLGARLRARCRQLGPGHRFVLFVDQFEELYTLGAGPAERAAFLACLTGVADDASSPLRVLVSLRSDFLDRAAEDRAFAAELTRGLVLLPPMRAEGLAEALTRPLEAAGYRVEDGAMVGAMLEALGRARSPLPLLQFTAGKLWEARDRERRLLTRASYERLGGVEGALSAHADAVLVGLLPAERDLCRALFLRLVTPERTRAVVELSELGAGEAERAAMAQLVARLVDARLVLVEPAGGRAGATVELVHESLIDRWASLKRWLDESEHDLQFLARLRSAAQQWRAGREAEGLLWREGAADEAKAWLARRAAGRAGAAGGLSADEERFLRGVVALADRARRRRRWLAAGAFAALAAFGLAVSWLALRARREAERARVEAARADREANHARNAARLAAARVLQARDPTLALGFLREVEPPGVPREWAERALSALHGGVTRRAFEHPDAVRTAAFDPAGGRIVTASADRVVRVFSADGRGEPIALRGHEELVVGAAFSPDGRLVASASRDRTARVWDAGGAGEPLVLRGHEDWVNTAAFGPDGKTLVTASRDRTLRLWRLDDPGRPLVLRGHGDNVYSAFFSPDGRQIVSASRDATVRLWGADGAGAPRVLRGHTDMVHIAAFSPDGQRIVSASQDGTVRLWSARDPLARPLVLRHEIAVIAAAFSPDGRTVATGTEDGIVHLWPSDGAGPPRRLLGHKAAVYSLAFDAAGRRLISASIDGSVREWAPFEEGAPAVLRGHKRGVFNVAFSPDGRQIATGSIDKTVRLWNADGSGQPAVLRGHQAALTALAFSPDGRYLATASTDKTARLWPARGAGGVEVLRDHQDSINGLAWSPDGRYLATASFDKTVRVTPVDGAGDTWVLRGHDDGATSVAFSPDGRLVATGSLDRVVRLWALRADRPLREWRGHEGWINTVAFSPDGRSVLSTSIDHTLRVWPVEGPGEPLVLTQESEVTAATFSPDGRQIASTAFDGVVRIWPADGRGEPVALLGHEEIANAVAFSPDGRRLVSGSFDGTARVWSDWQPLRDSNDPRLWAATELCPSVAARVNFLQASRPAAEADLAACQRRVAERRAQAAGRE
ncbi:MAG TPA: protein kinase [Polyangiaceae bacterium]|nr:protein kinase [Polyangiaceae bacterium]